MRMRIKLNLLPEDLRAVKVTKLPVWLTFNFFTVPILFLILNLLVDLVLGVMVLWKDADIKIITNKEKTLYPQREEQRRLEDRYKEYESLLAQRSRWGEVMNIISDCLPQTGWFTKFYLDNELGELIIKGSFYSREGGKGLTGEFIACLKSKPLLNKLFKSIVSKQITQRKIGPTEVQDFYLVFNMKKRVKKK